MGAAAPLIAVARRVGGWLRRLGNFLVGNFGGWPVSRGVTNPSAPASLCTTLAVFAFVGCAATGQAAEAAAAEREFDLPAERAAKTLRLFAEQAAVEVVFANEFTAHVHTRALHGRYAPEHALKLLLAGTGLIAERNPRTGAFLIRRILPQAPDHVPPATQATPTTTAHPHPKKSPAVKKRTLLSFFAATLTAIAQAAAPQAAETIAVNGRVSNAATGQYLYNARVTVRGTDLETFTDQTGTYRLAQVPAGKLELEVFFTGLDPLSVSLDLLPGQTVSKDLELTNQAHYGPAAKVLVLDPFLVAANIETNAAALAINEQRFAPNIKNVIATDAIGDVFGSSAGDFLKFLPGLAAEYDNADVSGISVRGIGASMTGIVLDGAPIAAANQSGPSRQIEMRTLALNNVSRIEVSKVPTPSSPADALAGSVNMISKTAFERKGAELRYAVNLTGNGNAVTLKKTPHGYLDRDTFKLLPGFEFDYTLPIGRNFGVVVTGMQSDRFNTQDLATTTWNNAGTATGASVGNPYLQQFVSRNFPRHTVRTVYSTKADWRVTPNSVLSVGGRWSRNVSARSGGFRLTANAGTNGTPTPATGRPMTYNPEFTQGATGRGAVSLLGEWQYGKTLSYGTDLNYRFDNGKWKIDSGFNYTGAQPVLNPARGPVFFNNVTAVLRTPVRVTFTGIGPDGPKTIQAFGNDNQEVDLRDINNYFVSSAVRAPRWQAAGSRFGKIDVRRRLSVLPFPTALQVGAQRQYQSIDTRWESASWTPAPDLGAAVFRYDRFVNQDLPGGFRNFSGLSPGKVYSAFNANPTLFTQTSAQVASAEIARLTSSERAEETVTAAYIQGEMRLLKNRLNVLTGVRFEATTNAGEGMFYDPNAVYVRAADGAFARTAQGARIRKPEAGPVGSIDEVRLTRKERGATAERTYDSYYPSLHLTYNIKENFVGRLAYARTYGRPDFSDIIPSATINEADLEPGNFGDPTVLQGTIAVRNTRLKPWTANNYDLSLEYYTQAGGVFTAGAFVKDISNFFGTEVRLATEADLAEVGLDPKYVGWNLSTKFNSGDARVSGVEVSVRHSLGELGAWGRHFTIFANATKLRLEGSAYASFESFIPKTANLGFSYSWKRISVIPKWNYRGLNKLVAVPAFGPDAFRYIDPRTIVDLNVVYRLTPRLALTGSINNLLNDRLTTLVYGSQTPSYARQSVVGDYGAMFSLGIKGRF